MKPQFIESNCLKCGNELVLSDLLDDPECDNPIIDEWACPNCYDGDGVYIDFAPGQVEELERRIEEIDNETVKTIPWKVVRKKLYDKLGLTKEEIEERKIAAKKAVKKDIGKLKSRRILNFEK